MQEFWYDMYGYEGYYQYSNTLKVKSLDRIITRKDGKKKLFKGRVLVVSKSDRYARVFLCKDCKCEYLHLHKFFAEMFIANPENKKYVNHINGNKLDYSLSNLEWATKGEDIKHAFRTGLKVATKGEKSNFWEQKYTTNRTGSKHPKSKIVLDTQTGIFYECVREAEEAKSISKNTLSAMLRGVIKNNTSLIFA